MSKNDWKKGKAESAMIEHEKQQMKKYAEEFRKKRKEDVNWTKYKHEK